MHDFAIVGGGIVGLSTGLALSRRYPDASILLLEKEKSWACHQTGRNSGVIHSGIYYKPGSLKAMLAVEGNRRMVAFCREHGIPHEVCGKVIVATRPEELPRLDALFQRGQENGLTLTKLDSEALEEIEPHATGLAAIHVPSTGIVNYRLVAETMAALLREAGADLRTGTEVQQILGSDKAARKPGKDDQAFRRSGVQALRNSSSLALDGAGVEIETNQGSFRSRVLINCAGLYSDRLARLAGLDPGVQIVPFRGEYYKLKPERRHLVKHLIYPVPDPQFPFLGVHFTRMIDGEVEAGPNAVLSLKREGYTRTSFSLKEFAEIAAYPGMRRLAARYWKEGAREVVRSFSKAAFVHSLQRLVPEIQAEDLEPAPAGVRAQALRPDGSLVDDFHILCHGNTVHVLNAPSPAATASLVIGEAIVDRIASRD
jgi:(S)-2-hydroxyglutarate dehydrogenase